MPAYPQLQQLLAAATADNAESVFSQRVVPYLVDVWLLDYEHVAGETEVVETTVSNFSYLFDIAAERLIAAWGISQGRFGGARDKSRMA